MKVKNFIKKNGVKVAGIGLSIAGFGLSIVQGIVDDKKQAKMIDEAVDAKIASIIAEGDTNNETE